jgi:hypothetical protein
LGSRDASDGSNSSPWPSIAIDYGGDPIRLALHVLRYTICCWGRCLTILGSSIGDVALQLQYWGRCSTILGTLLYSIGDVALQYWGRCFIVLGTLLHNIGDAALQLQYWGRCFAVLGTLLCSTGTLLYNTGDKNNTGMAVI